MKSEKNCEPRKSQAIEGAILGVILTLILASLSPVLRAQALGEMKTELISVKTSLIESK